MKEGEGQWREKGVEAAMQELLSTLSVNLTRVRFVCWQWPRLHCVITHIQAVLINYWCFLLVNVLQVCVCAYMCVSLLCCFILEMGDRCNSQKSRSYTSNLERDKAAQTKCDMRLLAVQGSICPALRLFFSLSSFRRHLCCHVGHQLGSRSCGAFITPSIIHSTHQPHHSGTDPGSGSTQQLVWLRLSWLAERLLWDLSDPAEHSLQQKQQHLILQLHSIKGQTH